VLFLIDAAAGIEAEDLRIGGALEVRKAVVVLNKMDLVTHGKMPKLPEIWSQWPMVRISAKYDQNVDELEALLVHVLQKEEFDPGEAIVPNLRQRGLIAECHERLSAAAARLEEGAGELGSFELAEAVALLDRILGKSTGMDLLDQVFKRFCIGK
jgi:tRNA modification GTPase